MQIKVYKELHKFTLTSTLKKEDLDIVKTYKPDAAKIKDENGDDVFGVSYVNGKPSVSACGITFGSVNSDGYLTVNGDYSEALCEEHIGDFVADKVGAALPHINALESSIPAVVAAIKAERAALIATIVEV